MIRRIFAAAALAVLAVLTGISLVSAEAGLSLPPKLVVLFGFLFIAAAAVRLGVTWLRYPLLIASIAYLGFFEGSCLCPNGALQNIPLFLGQGKAAAVGIYLLEITVLLAVVFVLGNLYCGWVCHKGGVQEFLFRPRWAIRVPPRLDAVLRHGRAALLAFIVVYPLIAQKKFFNQVDPFKALFNLRGSPALLAALGLTLVASVFIYRPFCRYVCPFGALAGAVGAVGLSRIKIGESCTACRQCAKACPAGALSVRRNGQKIETEFRGDLCLACLECRKACPRDGIEAVCGSRPSVPAFHLARSRMREAISTRLTNSAR
jgi:polyferredoxin